MKMCHNCKGKGIVQIKDFKGECYYCRGKGTRILNYGRDSTFNTTILN